mmetsp:Transcript_29705/g.79413  ORF Transcript_29705/g.79413 Transcript_29705/m.79413 type:complete len:266 (+) Transcript_29705:331-1128(+)
MLVLEVTASRNREPGHPQSGLPHGLLGAAVARHLLAHRLQRAHAPSSLAHDLRAGRVGLRVQRRVRPRLGARWGRPQLRLHGGVAGSVPHVVEVGAVVRCPVALLLEVRRHVLEVRDARRLLEHVEGALGKAAARGEPAVISHEPLRRICARGAGDHAVDPLLAAGRDAVSGHDSQEVWQRGRRGVVVLRAGHLQSGLGHREAAVHEVVVVSAGDAPRVRRERDLPGGDALEWEVVHLPDPRHLGVRLPGGVAQVQLLPVLREAR